MILINFVKKIFQILHFQFFTAPAVEPAQTGQAFCLKIAVYENNWFLVTQIQFY